MSIAVRSILLFACVGVTTLPAMAQVPPGAGVPALPYGSPLPRVLPPSPPSVQLPTVPGAPKAPVVPNVTVRITSVAVEGVTAYPHATIMALVQGLIGPAVPMTKIEAARQAILQHYRHDGYVLSAVSANIDGNGALRFVVTEGRIASVKLSHDIGPAGTQVLRFLKRLTEQTPINEATLERYLLLAQSVPGVTLHAVLQPSTEEPGALNLIAEVSRAPVSGLFTTDNYAAPYTGPIESLLVFDLNSFTQYGEQTQISLYHTWLNSQTFGQASTQVFLGSSGLTLNLYAGDGQTTPTGALAAENYLGITTVYGATLAYPVIRSRQQTLSVNAGLGGVDTAIHTTGVVSADQLRVAQMGANYARSDIVFGDSRPAVNTVMVRLSQGLPGLGASSNGSPDLPRPGERIDFFAFTGELTREQTLFSPWHDATVSVLGLLTGQWSPDILPPSEEFYLGGLQYNRGYYSGQVSGDKALAATVQLQLDTSLDLSALGLTNRIPVQFYTFYDWGEVWQNSPQGLGVHVNSAGGGVRINATRYAEVDLMGVGRLNRYPTGAGPNVTPLVPAAFYWRLLARF